jgi:hypothetical protein
LPNNSSLTGIISNVFLNHQLASKPNAPVSIISQLDSYNSGGPVTLISGTNGDPNYAPLLQAAVLAVAAGLSLTPIGRVILIFSFAAVKIGGSALALVDPSAGSHFVFSEQASSPNITFVALPSLPGLADYGFSYERNGSWSAPTVL